MFPTGSFAPAGQIFHLAPGKKSATCPNEGTWLRFFLSTRPEFGARPVQPNAGDPPGSQQVYGERVVR
jgi:hypothetical protein